VREALTSLFLSVVFSDEHKRKRCGGSPVALPHLNIFSENLYTVVFVFVSFS
jgi:hypothetical protein